MGEAAPACSPPPLPRPPATRASSLMYFAQATYSHIRAPHLLFYSLGRRLACSSQSCFCSFGSTQCFLLSITFNMSYSLSNSLLEFPLEETLYNT